MDVAPDSIAPGALAAAAAEKLPHEAEHLAGLERMRGLAPYYGWVLDLAERLNGGPLGRRILDAGCGIGNFVELLRGRADEVLAVDLSPRNIAVLRERFRGAPNVEVLQTDLDAERAALRARSVDAIVCLDVLEHLDDDAGLVRCFYDILPPGGTLFVKVPACPWLFGSLDEESDHRRRYTRRSPRRARARRGLRGAGGALHERGGGVAVLREGPDPEAPVDPVELVHAGPARRGSSARSASSARSTASRARRWGSRSCWWRAGRADRAAAAIPPDSRSAP